jgi:hypothetical protein
MVRVRDRAGLLGPVVGARSSVVTLVRASIDGDDE